MKWMIWPRQYGKTYQLTQWWVDNPANRVLLCGNEKLAQMRRDEVLPLLRETYPKSTDRDLRMLTKNRIYSFRTWRNSAPTCDQLKCQVAIDDLEVVLDALFKGKVVYAAGAGSNDTPEPAIADMVDEFNREVYERYGLGEG